MSEQPRLVVSASPHLGGPVDTPKIMWNVVLSLAPAMAWATWSWGPSALLVVGAAWAGAIAPEWFAKGRASLRDGSAAITGILLGMSLPPGFPCWMAFLGAAFGITAGKLLFGGLGQNVFNPALLGRAFLQAAFPVAITTWPKFGTSWFSLRGDNLALPFLSPEAPDVVTSATPLGLMKFEKTASPALDMFLGQQGGCIGETSDLLLLLGAAWLVWRRFMNWRTPAAIYATVGVFAAILSLAAPDKFAGPGFMLFSGGLSLGALYMATDPVTSPITARGCLIFGAGVGALVVLIRVWGGLPEGVMYSILIMNAFVPFINRGTQPRQFGSRTPQPAAAPGAAPAGEAKR